jgi:hypothetical protein
MHIVEDLVDVNFGVDEPAPLLVCDQIGSQQQVTAQAMQMLITAGALSNDPALERHIRQRFGLPAPDPDAPAPAPAPGDVA